MIKPDKPLNAKAYGSIGHLPQSRLGPGDWSVHVGQARICLEKPRSGDRVVVTEKLDGACMSVANIDGEIVALSRAGYRATDALYEHLKAFAPYVEKRQPVFRYLLRPGERVCGEWLALAHGTTYTPHHVGFAPFIAFDIIRGKDRLLRDEFVDRCGEAGVKTAALLHHGSAGFSIDEAEKLLSYCPLTDTYGFHGATEPVEGAVWRVEREGRVDFLAKWVRPDKVDGKYLPGTSCNVVENEPVWNWRETA